ncbi:tetratricopeptide repeat protein [candidate division KSB1 bacterium]
MKNTPSPILFFCVLLLNLPLVREASASIAPDSLAHFDPIPRKIINPAIDLIIRSEYERAQSYILEHTEKNSIIRDFLIASLHHARMGELESSEGSGMFLECVSLVTGKAEDILSSDHGNVTARFYLGTVKSYLAVYYNREGQFLKSISTARAAVGELEKCIAKNHDFPEPFLVIGSYNYWKSAKNFLRFLPGIPDKRDEAVREIRKNLLPGSVSYALGLNQLAWILIDFKRYDEAESLLREALHRYPGSRFFLYPAGILAQKQKEWDNASHYFGQMAESLQSDRLNNRSIWIKVSLKQADCLYQMAQYDAAVRVCRNIRQTTIHPDEREKAGKLITQASRLEHACVQMQRQKN